MNKKQTSYEMHFNPIFAEEYKNVNIAVFIKNFDFWLAKNKANGVNFYDGKYWTYNSYKALCEIYSWLSEKQIRTIIKKMIDYKIIVKSNYNQNKYDRTSWYSFADKFLDNFGDYLQYVQVESPKQKNQSAHLENSNCPNGQIKKSKKANQKDRQGEPIPYNIPYNKADNKLKDNTNILEKIKDKPVVDDLLKMNKEQLNKLYREYNGADPDPIVIPLLYIAGSRKYLHTDPPWDVLERLVFNTPYSVIWVRDAIIEMGNRIKRGGLVKNFNYGTILKIIKGWENQGLSEDESPLEHFEKIQSDINRERDRERENERGREENVVKCFDYYPVT